MKNTTKIFVQKNENLYICKDSLLKSNTQINDKQPAYKYIHRMSKKSFLPLFLLLSHFTVTYASPLSPLDSLKSFVKSIGVYNYMYPREQVYLHFDNTGYFMGEVIWFKAHVVSPQGFKPTALSRVLYVELLTPEGRIVKQQKLKIENGQCHGQIPLDEVLHAGFYEVRAYTALMRNWEDEPVFSRVFPIFNTPKEAGVYDNPRMGKLLHSERLHDKRERLPKTENLNMEFFPEGGEMVEGLPATVFFKATDKQSNALKVTGRLLNRQGKEVCSFASLHEGMGRFAFTPEAGETYRAEITVDGKGNAKSFDLPAAAKQGIVMSVNNLRDDRTYIQLTRSAEADTTRAVGLTVMCRGQVIKFRQVQWHGERTVLLDFPKQELPEGVNQVTLFDTEGHVYAERLCFIFPRQGKNISLVGEENRVLEPKEEVSLDFRVTDHEGKPVATNFSLSVRDADTETPVNGVNGGGMVANLLLGSELKGYIHNIDYYLESDDPAHRTDLDLLLCTQGWRKYDWKEMTHPQGFEVKYPIEEGIMVVGDLTSTFRNRKKEGVKIKVFLFNEAGYHLNASALTDSLGRFAFRAEDFTGRWQMHTLTYENGKAKEMNVNLDKMESPKARAIAAGETTLFIRRPVAEEGTSTFLPDSVVEYDEEVEKRRWENLLPTLKVQAQKEWQTPEVRRWHTDIYDMEEERMLIDETGEEYLENFWEWLMKTNPHFGYTNIRPAGKGVLTVPAYKSHPIKFRMQQVGKERGVTQIDDWILQPIPNSAYYDDLAILVENLTINDVEAIAITDKPSATVAFSGDIRRSEKDIISESSNTVWALDYTMDPNNKEGVRTSLAYVTLFVRENYFNCKDKRGHRKTKIQGFSPERRFYIPDYSDASLPNEQDFRRTLYWNPNVVTDTEGKATVKFYNTPHCKRMKISAESM